MQKYMILWPSLLTLYGCTYSITLAQSRGHSTDMVDQQQSASPEVSLSIPLPQKGLPK